MILIKKNQYFSPLQAEASAEAEADAQRPERDAQGYGYGGYGKYCQEVAQETAYNVPVPAPVDIPVKVSFILHILEKTCLIFIAKNKDVVLRR